jgi:hypothetical protein
VQGSRTARNGLERAWASTALLIAEAQAARYGVACGLVAHGTTESFEGLNPEEVALGALTELRAIASLAGFAVSLKMGRTDGLSRHGAFVVSRSCRAGCGRRRLEAFDVNRGDFAARIRH